MKKLHEQGQVHFEKIENYRKPVYHDGRKDEKEGHLLQHVENLVIAPILEDSKERIVYGDPIPLDDKVLIDISNTMVDQTPIFSSYCAEIDPETNIIKV